MNGLLLSFDGLDSSGKATQTRRLVERLRSIGHTVHQFQTPDYNTRSGKELQARLQNKVGNWQATPWQDKVEFFAANRAEHQAEVVAALARGEIVVYDRYVASSIAFITVEALSVKEIDQRRTEVQRVVATAEYQTHGMPPEDLSIFLDVPPAVTGSLLEQRKQQLQAPDEYTDQQSVQQRLYAEYDILCTQDPERFLKVACVADNQLLDPDTVSELVWEGIVNRFPSVANVS